jgi:hypothetical protein
MIILEELKYILAAKLIKKNNISIDNILQINFYGTTQSEINNNYCVVEFDIFLKDGHLNTNEGSVIHKDGITEYAVIGMFFLYHEYRYDKNDIILDINKIKNTLILL